MSRDCKVKDLPKGLVLRSGPWEDTLIVIDPELIVRFYKDNPPSVLLVDPNENVYGWEGPETFLPPEFAL